jgi:hypothetical protein
MSLKTWLCSKLRFKEIGWKEIDEEFIRYQIIKCKWFNIYLHYLDASIWEPTCHDHPWWFITLLIWPGYTEQVNGKLHRRWPGMVLYRPAKFQHRVLTPHGSSWSLILTGPKVREWGRFKCD